MKKARIYTNDFNRIIAATKTFVSKGTFRPAQQFIKLEFSAELQQVTAIAVDGYRMSVEHSIISDCDEDFVAYIKSNVKLPSGVYAEIILREENKEVEIRSTGFLFGYSQPDPFDFNWQKVIPKNEVSYKIGFNGNYLLEALQAAKASCGNSFKKAVVLEFRSPLEPIVLRTNTDDIKMVLPIRITED